jgi:hypothetical protein
MRGREVGWMDVGRPGGRSDGRSVLHLDLLTIEASRGCKMNSTVGVSTALVRVSMIQEVRRSGERLL